MNKTSKMLLLISLPILLLAVTLSIIFAKKSFATPLSDIASDLKGEDLIPLNKNARSACIRDLEDPYMIYKFSDDQKKEMASFRKANGGLALEVLLENESSSKEEKEGLFEFGYLYDPDFSSDKNPFPRESVKGNFASLKNDRVKLLFSIKNGSDLPSGFFVHSPAPCSLKEVRLSTSKIGWAKKTESGAPLFAFGPEGGYADRTFSSVDFSSAKSLFPSSNTASNLLPKVEFLLSPLSSECGSPENPLAITLNYGGKAFSMIRAKKLSAMVIQCASLENPFSLLTLEGNRGMVDSVFMSANDKSLLPEDGKAYRGLPTDLGLVEAWPLQNWRSAEYELYEWAEFPGILFFDFASSLIQDQFFTRLAYFVEKEGYKGTFVDDDFILNNHGYNAHDYSSESLADFFTQAKKNKISLNERELLLKKILLSNGIIKEEKEGNFSAGSGAVVSMSRSSSRELRKKFLAHECWHGIYFTNESFRNLVEQLHEDFNPRAKEFLELYWENNPNLHYDRSDSFLMKNEFMAYLLQQDPKEGCEYFLRWAKESFMPDIAASLCTYVNQTDARDFFNAATLLDRWTFDRWGLGGGRVWLLTD